MNINLFNALDETMKKKIIIIRVGIIPILFLFSPQKKTKRKAKRWRNENNVFDKKRFMVDGHAINVSGIEREIVYIESV